MITIILIVCIFVLNTITLILTTSKKCTTEDFHLQNNQTIFVSIPSYREAECSNTLNSLFSKARNPYRIFIGVFEQNDLDSEKEKCTVNDKYKSQVRKLKVPHTEAKGPLWARMQIAKDLYKGENYYLMIDAHSTFLKDWDSRLIQQLNYLRNRHNVPKPILSTYIHSDESLKKENKLLRDTTTTICDVKTVERYPTVLGSQNKPSGKYYKSPFVGAGFIFTYGDFCKNLIQKLNGLDFFHIFGGEEILIAAFAYTHGWDVYSPPYVNVFHNYNVEGKPNWFTDNIKKVEKERRIGEDTLKKILDTEDTKYPLGNIRSLKDFWKEIGFRRENLDKNERKIEDVYPKENKIKWCENPPHLDYPLTE